MSLMCEVAGAQRIESEEELVEGLSRNYRSMTSIIIRFPVSRKRPHKAGEEVVVSLEIRLFQQYNRPNFSWEIIVQGQGLWLEPWRS